jgi:hypothetical protein
MKLFNHLIRILVDDSTRERFQQEGREIKGFQGFLRIFFGHFHHLTLFNPLGLLAGIAFTVSLFYPWWHVTVREGRNGEFAIFQSMAKVTIHAYFLPSYYWAIGAGIVCLLSSLTHGWVPIRFHSGNKGIG